jgi:hypothetical protein
MTDNERRQWHEDVMKQYKWLEIINGL